MLRKLESPGAVALVAGVGLYLLAFATIVFFPAILTNADEPVVVGHDGVPRAVRPYTEVEQRGRTVYGQQVCFHCHSQFVRPVNDEVTRFGPLSQTGEYAHDLPHFFGTRRIGPDLHREGLLRVDDWHYAHFFNPRFTVPRSVMPAFPWLFHDNPRAGAVGEVLGLLDTNGDGVLSTLIGDDGGEPGAGVPEDVRRLVRQARERAANTSPFERLDRRGLLSVGGAVDSMWYAEDPESGENLLTDYDAAPLPNGECVALVTYVQRLGTSIGMWRAPQPAPTPDRSSPFDAVEPRPRRTEAMRLHGFHRHDPSLVEAAAKATQAYEAAAAAWDRRHPALAARLQRGKQVFDRHCAGCHGAEGRGNGEGAQFMLVRPRDFTVGKYKFRSTPVGAMPLDGDLFRSIHRGLPGTSMPSWSELPDEQIWLLVDYVKSLFEGDKPFNERTKVLPTTPERFHPDPARELLRGRAVYLSSGPQCQNCHGLEGRGDGPGWNTQASNYGAAMRPRDLRPRVRIEDAPELYDLLGKRIALLVGEAGWKTLSAAKGWADLAPTDVERMKAFTLFLLGEGPRVQAVFGADAVAAAFGDRHRELFQKGDDPLEAVRMGVATEKERPALRFRGGASVHDVYRTVMAGIEGTAMKSSWDQFFELTDPKPEWDPKLPRQDKRFVYLPRTVEMKLSIVTNDARLKEVGVYTKEVDGKVEEWIKLQPGDDWALVHYVRWLMCEPRERTGGR